MTSGQYRRLLTNLPSMATVVNAFQSADVQLAVYRTLIEALLEATSDDSGSSSSRLSKGKTRGEMDVVEGDNIHSITAD